jgi:DNA repair photolyase
MYLKCKVPRISDARIKDGVFVGPQIRDYIGLKFEDKLSEVEKAARKSLKKITTSFLRGRGGKS